MILEVPTTEWYEEVDQSEPITQGDLIPNCPLFRWSGGTSIKDLEIDAIFNDSIVITQACDLEHNKVEVVTLCAHIALTEYQEQWKESISRHSSPTKKAWERLWDDLKKGLTPSHTIVGPYPKLEMDYRIVAFDELFTLPVGMLNEYLKQQTGTRLRLLAPYREHLSQAFARYFMRVGLPVPFPNESPIEFKP